MINRVIWIVLDSVGMGEMPDAEKYGDVGANTIGNISKVLGGLTLPNLEKLGLGNVDTIKGVEKVENPIGCYARLEETSNGKDTTTGHWEMAGVVSKKPFPTYPNGFPLDVVEAFERAIGRKIIGNKPASGTAIIDELGEEHIKTGQPIVYTSADSVFQIAAHEDVIPLEELYKMCEIARHILTGEHAVARVIARPFIGNMSNFTRTPNRRDFSLVPPHDTLLDVLKNNGLNVMAVGKIEDIFCGKGITEAIHTKDNMDGMDQTLNYLKQDKKGLIFTNLVDFDMKWGHRNDPEAYGKGLEAFDVRLGEVLAQMKDTDTLIITADHGCDPTTPGTDHTREYVPLIAYGKELKSNVNLGTRKSFADIGQTVAEIFSIPSIKNGESFLKEILR
ncbi:phosphopentomutase [Clostridium sp. PL3]|uniref:Phosphopentomutase n=1 Tax=Clostridium thailandense TaxID=2794346 RepID=A0A949WTF6_9CLOT|nr:phosphopentomutase [Clostridium thailandense]MBV7276141.1 phosphopentomutase [Clostridium thailandense]